MSGLTGKTPAVTYDYLLITDKGLEDNIIRDGLGQAVSTLNLSGTFTSTNLSGTNTGDQTAATLPFTPYGGLGGSNVQAVLQELEDEKSSVEHVHVADDITDFATEVPLSITAGNALSWTANTLDFDYQINQNLRTSDSPVFNNLRANALGIGISANYDIEIYGSNASLITHYVGHTRGGLSSLTSQRLAMHTTSSADDLVFGYNASDQVNFSSSFVQRAKIDNGNGYMKVGSGNPSYRLDVDSHIRSSGDMYMGYRLYHDGDANTYIQYDDDQVQMYAGGYRFFRLIENGASSQWVFNEDSYDIDVRWESNTRSYGLFFRGSDGHLGINSSNPVYDLDVVGEARITAKLVIPANATSGSSVNTDGEIEIGTASGSAAIYFQTEGTSYLVYGTQAY